MAFNTSLGLVNGLHLLFDAPPVGESACLVHM